MIVSIDLETTGLDPETCQILEIGMIDENGDTFHCYVDNGLIRGEPYALQMNRAILEKIADGYGTDVSEVAKIMRAWLPDDFTVAGKNFAAFDLPFLKRLPGWDIKIRHRIIDVGNLYWRPDIDGDKLPDLGLCMRRAGIPDFVTHRGLEDAEIVMDLIKRYQDANS